MFKDLEFEGSRLLSSGVQGFQGVRIASEVALLEEVWGFSFSPFRV